MSRYQPAAYYTILFCLFACILGVQSGTTSAQGFDEGCEEIASPKVRFYLEVDDTYNGNTTPGLVVNETFQVTIWSKDVQDNPTRSLRSAPVDLRFTKTVATIPSNPNPGINFEYPIGFTNHTAVVNANTNGAMKFLNNSYLISAQTDLEYQVVAVVTMNAIAAGTLRLDTKPSAWSNPAPAVLIYGNSNDQTANSEFCYYETIVSSSSGTSTATPTDTETPVDTSTPSSTDYPTYTPYPTYTNYPTYTPYPTNTPNDIPTDTPTVTEAASITPTDTPIDIPTDTPTVTEAASITPTDTPIDIPTDTPTVTEVASITPTNAPTDAPTITPTDIDPITPTPEITSIPPTEASILKITYNLTGSEVQLTWKDLNSGEIDFNLERKIDEGEWTPLSSTDVILRSMNIDGSHIYLDQLNNICSSDQSVTNLQYRVRVQQPVSDYAYFVDYTDDSTDSNLDDYTVTIPCPDQGISIKSPLGAEKEGKPGKYKAYPVLDFRSMPEVIWTHAESIAYYRLEITTPNNAVVKIKTNEWNWKKIPASSVCDNWVCTVDLQPYLNKFELNGKYRIVLTPLDLNETAMSNIEVTPSKAKLKLDFARLIAFNFDVTSLGQPPVDWVCPKAYTFYRITFDPVNNGQNLIIDWGQRGEFKVNNTLCELGVEDWAGQYLMDAICDDYSHPAGINYPFNWFAEAAIDVDGDNVVDDDVILKSNLASLDYEGFTCIPVGVTSTGLTWQEASGNLQTTDYLIKVETTEGILIAEKTISSAALCENGNCDLDLAIVLPDLSPATYIVRISVVNQSELRFKAVSYTIGQETSRSHLLPLPPVIYSGLSNR